MTKHIDIYVERAGTSPYLRTLEWDSETGVYFPRRVYMYPNEGDEYYHYKPLKQNIARRREMIKKWEEQGKTVQSKNHLGIRMGDGGQNPTLMRKLFLDRFEPGRLIGSFKDFDWALDSSLVSAFYFDGRLTTKDEAKRIGWAYIKELIDSECLQIAMVIPEDQVNAA